MGFDTPYKCAIAYIFQRVSVGWRRLKVAVLVGISVSTVSVFPSKFDWRIMIKVDVYRDRIRTDSPGA